MAGTAPMGRVTPLGHSTSDATYAALRQREEQRFAAVGGRGIRLVRDEVVTVSDPPPLLADLRAGRPATVNAFRIPRRFRPDEINPSDPVTVYPNGRIETS